MNIFGIGLPEMAVIAAIGLLVFGPKRLPELGRTLGRTLKGFQSASSEFEREFRTAIATAEPVQEESAQLGEGSSPAAQASPATAGDALPSTPASAASSAETPPAG